MQFDEISLNVAQSNHSSNFVKIYLQFVLIHFFLLEMSRDYRAPTCFTACFSKAFPKEEYANLVCSVICLWGVCRTTVGEMCKYLHILTQVRQRKGNHFTLFLKSSHVTQWDITWLYFWLLFHWNCKKYAVVSDGVAITIFKI